MKEITCTECGDTIYVPEEGEFIQGQGETIISHMERTGHVANAPQ